MDEKDWFALWPFCEYSSAGKGGFLFGGGRRVMEEEVTRFNGGRGDSSKGRDADLEVGFERMLEGVD